MQSRKYPKLNTKLRPNQNGLQESKFTTERQLEGIRITNLTITFTFTNFRKLLDTISRKTAESCSKHIA